MRPLLACLVLAAVVCVPLGATTVSVSIRFAGSAPEHPIDGTLIVSPIAMASGGAPRTIEIHIPGVTSLELAPGVWRFEIHGEHLFHAERSAEIKGDSASLDLTVWQTRPIKGEISPGSGAMPANLTMTARWSSSRDVASAITVPEGEAPCVVSGRQFECQVPRAVIDLRLRPRGYVSAFFWSVKADQEATPVLPGITLKRGGAIVGYVIAAKDLRTDPAKIRVSAFSQSALQSTPTHTTTIDRRGFFSLEGVEPGFYRIAATSGPGVGSEERVVELKPRLEAELLRPLVLEKLTPLRVMVRPALVPEIGPWRVSVEKPRNSAVSDRIGETASKGANGEYELGALPAGDYVIRVASARHEGDYARREIRLPQSAPVGVDVDLTHVEGTVMLGDEPIASQLWIGGRYRSPSVHMTSDKSGQFSGFVPANSSGQWLITVDAAEPRISAELNVSPVVTDVGVRLDLRLPSGTIKGTVTEAATGAPVPAMVNVSRLDGGSDSPGGVLQTSSSATDGRFSLTGLRTGRYAVQAEARGGRTTDQVTVEVTDDSNIADVKLTLGPDSRLNGRVVTESGAPVAGARVYVIPLETPPVLWVPRTTSAAGDFDVALPANTGSAMIAVISAGFPFRMFRAPVDFARRLNITLRQNGGAIELEGATTLKNTLPMIVHNGTALPLMFFLSSGIATLSGSGAAALTTLPLVEPGDYALCAAPPGTPWSYGLQSHSASDCAAGVLAPFGTLRLHAPAR